MIVRPRIKSKYHVEPVSGDGVFLLAENERHVLEGEHLLQILPFLDGSRTWEEIVLAVSGRVSPDDARAAFDVLLRYGHVEEGEGALPPELQAFWSELGRSAADAQRLVASTNIHLLPIGRVSTAAFEQSVRSFGFRRDDYAPASVRVVIADDYARPEIEAINRHCLDHGTPWALVKPGGLIAFVGPFLRPGKTACWKCLESRLRHNREVESYVQRKKDLTAPLPTTRMQVPIAEAQAVSIATIQLVRWLATGENPALESRLLALDVLGAQQSSHYVVRRPQCEACGDPRLGHVGGRAVALQSRALSARDGNGLRAEPPETTFERYRHHVSPYTGAVQGIFPSPWNGVSPLRVYSAGHNFAMKNDQLYFLKDGLRTSSSGKGRTDAQARTSALCEALERFSGMHRGEEERRFASLSELGDEAVDPRSVALFSERQYEEREAWAARNSRFQFVPLPFDEEARISWSPVWSWTRKERRYLPTSQLYYSFEDSPETAFFWGDSNGAAAGSCLEDAVLQGFFELVERDAVALWWYNRVPRPALDLDSLKDPYVDELRAFYEAAGRRIWVLDLTADLGIPVFAAVHQRLGAAAEDLFFGFGAHLDARIAVSRALTELNQFIPAVLSTNEQGETQYAFADPEFLNWWKEAKLEEHPYLAPSGESARLIVDLPSVPGGDVKAQLEDCFSRVEKRGHEVLILDQTRPDIGLPTAKVVVPGLRHLWARFAPGRLYDVPVELGWKDRPLTEDELNPVAMFV